MDLGYKMLMPSVMLKINLYSFFFSFCNHDAPLLIFYLQRCLRVTLLWNKTVPLFCLFSNTVCGMLCPPGAPLTFHEAATWLKKSIFKAAPSSNQNSIIDFTSRGTQGSQGPWQFYLRKKLKGFESPRMSRQRGGGRGMCLCMCVCVEVGGEDREEGGIRTSGP